MLKLNIEILHLAQKKWKKSSTPCVVLGAVREIPQQLKVRVTGGAGVRAHAELGSGCPGAHSLRGCLKNLPVCILRHILSIFPWLLLFLGGCDSVWAGFFRSSLSVFWQPCLRSQLHCLEVCHHCFVMSLICHPDLSAASLLHLQRQCWPVCCELGELTVNSMCSDLQPWLLLRSSCVFITL